MATSLNNLAGLLEDQGQWLEAVALFRKAKPIMTGAHTGSEPERGGLGKAVLAQNTGGLRAYARALYRAGASDFANRAEGFEAAQWALQNDAADALSAMAARFAKGGQELAKLVREQQDLLDAREAAYRRLDAAAGKADAKAAEVRAPRLRRLSASLRRSRPRCARLSPITRNWPIRSRFRLRTRKRCWAKGMRWCCFSISGNTARFPKRRLSSR